MSNPNVRGQFVWHELLTSNPKAAPTFYTKVVGWSVQKWENDPSYQMFVGKAGPVAGFMALPEEARAMGAPPHWMSYIGVPDVDATAAQAAALGSRILRAPDDIPGVGRFAVLSDPQGAVFSIFSPSGDSPERDQQTPGEFSWHELATTDLDAAWSFYTTLFGWQKTDAMDMGPELGVYQMYGHRGLILGGMYRKPASMPAPPHWLPYALVRDSKAAAATIAKLGGKVINGPMQVPGGDWIVMALDPQGVAFALHSKAPKPAAAAKPKAAKPVKKAAGKKTAGKKAAKKKAAKKKVAKKPARKKAAKRKAPRRKPANKATRRTPRKRARGRKVARKRVKKAAGRRKKK